MRDLGRELADLSPGEDCSRTEIIAWIGRPSAAGSTSAWKPRITPLVPQRAHPPETCRRRDADTLGERIVRYSGIRDEFVQDAFVDVVYRPRANILRNWR